MTIPPITNTLTTPPTALEEGDSLGLTVKSEITETKLTQHTGGPIPKFTPGVMRKLFPPDNQT